MSGTIRHAFHARLVRISPPGGARLTPDRHRAARPTNHSGLRRLLRRAGRISTPAARPRARTPAPPAPFRANDAARNATEQDRAHRAQATARASCRIRAQPVPLLRGTAGPLHAHAPRLAQTARHPDQPPASSRAQLPRSRSAADRTAQRGARPAPTRARPQTRAMPIAPASPRPPPRKPRATRHAAAMPHAQGERISAAAKARSAPGTREKGLPERRAPSPALGPAYRPGETGRPRPNSRRAFTARSREWR